MTVRSTRILVVEDDAAIAFALESFLGSLGYDVVGLATLTAGLDYAANELIDFALLDFDLGQDTNSVPIAQLLHGRSVPFAFLTGTEVEFVRRSFPHAPVLSKPVKLKELRNVLPTAGQP